MSTLNRFWQAASIAKMTNFQRTVLAFGYHIETKYIPSDACWDAAVYDSDGKIVAIGALADTEAEALEHLEELLTPYFRAKLRHN